MGCVYVYMTHPTDVERPDGIELDSFGDEEKDNKLTEYVKFTAAPTIEEEIVEAFDESLRSECNDWDVSVSRSPDGDVLIELHIVHHDFDEEPLMPEDVREEYREAEGEYYRKMHEAETDN